MNKEELEKAVEEARVTMLAARVTYAETWQDAADARFTARVTAKSAREWAKKRITTKATAEVAWRDYRKAVGELYIHLQQEK